MKSASLSKKKGKGSEDSPRRVSYTVVEELGVPAYFTRERCIRVVAITIIITLGISNICGVENKKPRVAPPTTNTYHGV
jgi:hypothetical protein